MPEPGAAVFIDFDGTITTDDATDAILHAFADPAWQQIEQAWLSGTIGSRECLAAQMALVRATSEHVGAVLDAIEVDHGFPALLDVCSARALPVHIVSDGFDYCIKRILGRPDRNLLARLADSQLVASSLHWNGEQWLTGFEHPSALCVHGCATCKPRAMARLTPRHTLSIFIGDGMSDRYAASDADVVFAKGQLAHFCARASIPYTPYDTLDSVAAAIERLIPDPRRHRQSPPEATGSPA